MDRVQRNYLSHIYTQFSKLRADSGIRDRWQELEGLVETSQKVFERLTQSSDDLFFFDGHKISRDQLTFAIASLFIFSYYRLNGKFGKKSIVNMAIDYLLNNQYFSLFDAPNKGSFVRPNITLMAMTVHALAIAKLPDSQEFLTKAKDWLLENQTKYGHWYQIGAYPDETTVLVLDALELANGGINVTFDISGQGKGIDENKSKTSLILSPDNKSHRIAKSGVEKLEIQINLKNNSGGQYKKGKSKITDNKQPARTPVKP